EAEPPENQKTSLPGKPQACRTVLRHRRPKYNSLFFPMYSRKILWIEQLRIERHIGAQIRILFRRDNLSIDAEAHFRRPPAAAQFLILVELCLLRLRAVSS